MKLKDFLRIAEYGSEAWKGYLTPIEVTNNAQIYWADFEWSKENKRPSFIIKELISLLKEDGTEECLEWAEQIVREINGTEM